MSVRINFIQRKSIRERAWKTLSVVVGITTILNVSMVGALIAPQAASAVGGYTTTLTSPAASASSTTYTWQVSGTKPGPGKEISHVTFDGCWTKSQIDQSASSTTQGTLVFNNDGSVKIDNLSDVKLPLTLTLVFTVSFVNTGSTAIDVKGGTNHFTSATGGPNCSTTNPPLGQSCGLDIALVVDTSGSVDSGEMSQMKTALKNFALAFDGTPTVFSLSSFSVNSTQERAFSRTPIQMGSTGGDIDDDIPASGNGYTNWDSGLHRGFDTFDPRAAKANLLVIATDGSPNHWGYPTYTGGFDWDLGFQNAIPTANAIKQSGTRIVVVGIGEDGTDPATPAEKLEKMKAISGPQVATTPAQISTTTDVIKVTDFSGIGSSLAAFASELCGGKILVQKQFDTNGDSQADILGNVADPLLAGYTFDVNGTPSNPAPAVTNTTGSVQFDVESGTYSVTETNLPAGTKLVSATCNQPNQVINLETKTVSNLTMPAEGTISCTFVNGYATGSLKVTKVVNDGTAKPHEFGFRLDNDGAYTYPAADQNYVIFNNLAAGSVVSVNETTGSLPYHQTGNTCVDKTIVAGQQVTCTITNSRDVGTLKVIKHVVGGTADASAWQLHVKHNDAEVTNSPQAGSEAGTVYELPTGTYVVSETGGPTDYTQTFSTSCEKGVVDVVNGQQAVCTVMNTRNTGRIVFDKVVDNEPNANVQPFTFTVDGHDYHDGDSASFDTGEYTLTENDVPGYTFVSASGICSLNEKQEIVLNVTENGGTCTITNHRYTGSLTVNKMVDLKGDGNFTSVSGEATPFRWQLNGGSNQLMGSTLSNLPTGSNYDVTENSVEHFDFVGWYYTGEDYTCARPQHNGLPTGLTVSKDANTSITLCNARDYKDPVTLNAWKIVCTNEADLPNWGATGGPNITATTAQDWVNSHESCSLKSGWDFQYAADLPWPGNPGDNTGAAGAPWTTFGPTDANGFTSASIADVDGITLLWVREVWQNGYIPFTMGPNYDNSNDVSAEMYCHTDVINYDNFEWINNLQAGQTYNCVAWNVENTSTVTVTKQLDRDGNGTFETTNPQDWVWELDNQTGLTMGDTVSTVMGPHTVKESGPSDGYHFVGWYYTNNDVSCEDGKINTTYPIDITSAPGQETAITLCNARDTGTIDGYKWDDRNGNSLWDNGEPALANFRMQTLHGLYGVTDGNGYYRIENVPTGTESLVEFAWNGSHWVSPDQLGWDMTYPTNVSGFAALDLVITYGQTTHQDFGNFKPGFIHGFKYDNHENKLDGWTICLGPWNDDALSLMSIDSNCVVTGDGEWPTGYYEFTNVAAGTYRLYEYMQNGWTAVSPQQGEYTDVQVDPGADLSYDFVNRQVFPDLSVTKTDGATTRQPGDLVTYELVVKNEGEYPAYNAQAVDTLPPYMTFQSSTVDGSPLAPAQSGATLTWYLGTMNPDAIHTILVTVKYDTVFPAGTTNLNNCVAVSLGSDEVVREVQSSAIGEQNTENNVACDNNTVDAAPTIQLVKTGPATVTAGQNIVYTLAWSVGGNAPASQAIVSDTVPSNTSFDSATCGTTIGACGMSSVNGTVTWDLGTRQPGESGTVTMTVKAASPIANGTLVKNTACFDTSENDKVCDDETTTIQSAPSLSITKTNNVIGFTNPGKTVTYTVTVTNAAGATDTAHNVGLTDLLPTGFTYTIGGGTTKSFALGEIAPGVSVVTTYSALISDAQTAGLYTNTASAKGDNTTTVVATSTVDVRVPSVLAVTSEPTLTLTKTVDTATTNPGKTITYTVTISNPGDVDVTGVSMTDTLPKGFVFVDSGKATKTWDLGTLKAHHQRVLNYLVRINDSVKAGEYINKAVLLSAELDPITAQAKVTVKVPRVLGLATTGISTRDYFVFAIGALALALGIGWTIRLGRRSDEAITA